GKIASALDFRAGPDGAMIGERSLHDLLVARFGRDANSYIEGAISLSRIMDRFESIDEVLHWFSSKSEIVSLGKATIVREILRAERASTLFNAEHPNTSRGADFGDTWLPSFLAVAMNGLKRENAAGAFSKVTIINFNYDRIIEHFLYS